MVNAFAHAAPVDLELGFARTPAADAARKAGHGRVLGDQPGQHVVQLRQLHLQLALPAARALGENVQNQLGAVDHLERDLVGDRTDLGS